MKKRITDRYGRVWTHFDRELYAHCRMAFPERMIATLGLPSPSLADNPNYDLCEICRQEWPK